MTYYHHIAGIALFVSALPASAFTPSGSNIAYQLGDEAFEGYFVAAKGNAKGSVVIVHDWDGLDDYERQRADMLADQGYDSFAIDLYGEGNRPQALEDKQAATRQLYEDRERMRYLTHGGIEAALTEGIAENSVLLGYCFGGSVVLEMARANTLENAAGYASFHGGLETPEGQAYVNGISPIFIAHGGGDQIVSLESVSSLASALEEADISYEVGIYSGAPHAFSVFGSDRYEEQADQRSWATFTQWLEWQMN
ncbi:dienelactone hydrolase family protein [Vreelandella aquamarina]